MPVKAPNFLARHPGIRDTLLPVATTVSALATDFHGLSYGTARFSLILSGSIGLGMGWVVSALLRKSDKTSAAAERALAAETLNAATKERERIQAAHTNMAAIALENVQLRLQLGDNQGRSRFVSVRELGVGGMGSVHEVIEILDPEHQRSLAIKFPDLNNLAVVERFPLEANALRLLTNPESYAKSGIAPEIVAEGLKHIGGFYPDQKITYKEVKHFIVLPLQDDDPVPCLSMELLQGRKLSDILDTQMQNSDQNWLRLDRATALIRDMVYALLLMEATDIKHRDLKPENVIVVEGRGPVLIDFGIAKGEEDPERKRLTAIGTMMGTPGNMAPEQMGMMEKMGEIIGRHVSGDPTPKTDLYALGIMFWELVTGEQLFETGEDQLSRTWKAWEKMPNLPSIAETLKGIGHPVSKNEAALKIIDRIFSNLLNFDPELRYPSGADGRSGLYNLLNDLDALDALITARSNTGGEKHAHHKTETS